MFIGGLNWETTDRMYFMQDMDRKGIIYMEFNLTGLWQILFVNISLNSARSKNAQSCGIAPRSARVVLDS